MCPYCGVGCQLTYHIKNDKLLYVTGKRRPGEPEPAVREGPLRLRLCQQSAAADQADGAQGRRGESAPTIWSIRQIRGRISAKPPGKRRWSAPPPGLKKIRDRDGPRALAGFGSAKGSNEEAYLFQKLVRTGFGSNNVDHCTRLCHASSVAALLEGVGSARCHRDLQRVQEFRRHHRDRRQSDRKPSGRRDFLQAGGQARRQAGGDGPARAGAQAPCLADDAVQERHRRRDAQRHAQRHHRRETLRPAIRPDLCRRLRPTRRAREGLHAGGDGADLRHSRRHAARSGAHLCARRKRHHLLGHGRVAAYPRHRQCALPDRAVADLRPGRPARHRACIRCADRTTCRVPPTPA